MERTRKKQQNIFIRYFTPFGLKQVADLVMLAGFVLLIVGLCTTDGVLLAGFIAYALGALASVALCCKILIKTENHRDPNYKTAVVNVAIMSVLAALAIFGLVWTIVA